MARLTRRCTVALATLLAAVLSLMPDATAKTTSIDTVTISMGYIPNVQFAPFYLAVARGYYQAEHLRVRFNYALSSDVVREVGSGSIAFGNAEADQVIIGSTRGLPVVSIFTQYQRFPVVIFALQSSGIHRFADLKGKTIGIPGLYGASYTGLLAALHAARLTTSDVHIEAIGYAQVAEVARHRLDAAVGFAMNEPVQLRQQGYKVTVLPIASLVPMAGPGVVTSKDMIAHHEDLVRRFIAATYRGQQVTDANPDAAFTIARRFMPSLAAAQVPYQRAVLRESVRYWTPTAGHRLGCTDPATWRATLATLLSQHQVSTSPTLSTLYTDRFVPGC